MKLEVRGYNDTTIYNRREYFRSEGQKLRAGIGSLRYKTKKTLRIQRRYADEINRNKT